MIQPAVASEEIVGARLKKIDETLQNVADQLSRINALLGELIQTLQTICGRIP